MWIYAAYTYIAVVFTQAHFHCLKKDEHARKRQLYAFPLYAASKSTHETHLVIKSIQSQYLNPYLNPIHTRVFGLLGMFNL